MAREAALVASAHREYSRRGAHAWHYKTHGHDRGRAGIPDELVCYRGRFLAVEYKQPGKHPEPIQEWELERIRDAGGMAIVATSIDDIRQALDYLDAEAAA